MAPFIKEPKSVASYSLEEVKVASSLASHMSFHKMLLRAQQSGSTPVDNLSLISGTHICTIHGPCAHTKK